MTDKPSTTVWMWRHEDGGVGSAVLDLDEGVVKWYDEIGCACDDNAYEQRFADFLAKGARYGEPPADVEAEMKSVIQSLSVGEASEGR